MLQLDPASHYGGSWASLRPREWDRLLALPADAAAAGVSGALTWRRPGFDLGAGGQQAERQYSLDLAPKVAYGAGPLIQLLLGSGAHHYLEFKLVQGRSVPPAAPLRQGRRPASRPAHHSGWFVPQVHSLGFLTAALARPQHPRAAPMMQLRAADGGRAWRRTGGGRAA